MSAPHGTTGPRMTTAAIYRKKAEEFAALADLEASPELQLEYAKMATAYFRLAGLADRNNESAVAGATALQSRINAED